MPALIDRYRKKKDGGAVAMLHHYMEELGIEHDFTTEDVELIKSGLAEARMKKDGWGISYTLYHLKDAVIPVKDGGRENLSPPLKRFA